MFYLSACILDDGVDDGGGSCTEDDLSGSEEDLDGQDENKEVESQYEVYSICLVSKNKLYTGCPKKKVLRFDS